MTTKQKLIEAFLKLVLEEGYSSVSVGNLSKEVGIAKSSFYSHFNSIDDVETSVEVYCLESLQKADFKIDFKSKDVETLLVTLINSFIDTFSQYPSNAFLSLIESLKMNNPHYFDLSKRIDMMISARITVALDFCVQRGWSNLNDTDSVSKILTPFVRSILIDGNLSDEELTESIQNIISIISQRI